MESRSSKRQPEQQPDPITAVAAGAHVTERRGERVLMNPDGSWLDTRNITKIGLDYAERLASEA